MIHILQNQRAHATTSQKFFFRKAIFFCTSETRYVGATQAKNGFKCYKTVTLISLVLKFYNKEKILSTNVVFEKVTVL